MERICRKLKSSSGASIVLTLLFLLITMMVGASILMAASSNAGKSRSNREENQIYLALSSALRMVMDDLQGGEYCGQYHYTKETVELPPVTGTPENPEPEGDPTDPGSPEEPEKITYDRETYTQTEGKYECGLGKIVLGDLDALFAKDMQKWLEEKNAEAAYSDAVQGTVLAVPGTPSHTLTVASDVEEIKDYIVTITLSVKESYSIELQASMAEYPYFIMRAELTPDGTNRPAVNAANISDEINQTNPMKWKLGWITTGTEESDEEP